MTDIVLIFIWIVIIPLIVKHHTAINPLVGYFWADQIPYYNDFFLYYKMLAVIATAILMTAIMVIRAFYHKKTTEAAGLGSSENEIPKTPVTGISSSPVDAIGKAPRSDKAVPLYIYFVVFYLIAVVISTLFSVDYPATFLGFPGQLETFFVQTGYIISFFFIRRFIKESPKYIFSKTDNQDSCSNKDTLPEGKAHTPFYQRYLSRTGFICAFIFLGAVLSCLICVPQALGADIYRIIYEPLGFTFNFKKGLVYGSFYNPNYVGGYFVLVFPFVIYFFYKGIQSGSKPRILISALTAAGLIISLFKADSFSGVVSFIITGIFSIIVIFIKKAAGSADFNRKAALQMVSVAALIIVISLPIAVLANRTKISAWKGYQNITKTELQHIYTRENGVEVHYNGRIYTASLKDGEIYLEDVSGYEIPQYLDNHGKRYETVHPAEDDIYHLRYDKVFIDDDENLPGFTISFDNQVYAFASNTGDNPTYTYCPHPGIRVVLDESLDAKTFGPLKNYSGLFARGYMWGRTIPLLKETLIYGSGPDTFGFMFPNYDIVDMYNNKDGYGGSYITKPHSIYLQMGVQTGVISMICFIGLCLWVVLNNLKGYFSATYSVNQKNCRGFINLAIAVSILGYMIYGLCNDSSITTAPILWAVLALGVSLEKAY